MTSRILVAGATGAVGAPLIKLLRDAGHEVAGTTRKDSGVATLRALGAEGLKLDVFDVEALTRATISFRPEIVIHQLTDLPDGLDPSQMGEAIVRNARIRDEGTGNLVKAALAAGAQRLIAQSIAWAYAPGPEPHSEEDALNIAATGNAAISIGGVLALERQVLNAPPLAGLVLRYGRLYGPGTGADAPASALALHVDAAAHAAFLAVDRGAPGGYNIAEPNAEVATEKAQRALGWCADFRLQD
jgi:nucleoside-diphosphate-sugar epimerase